MPLWSLQLLRSVLILYLYYVLPSILLSTTTYNSQRAHMTENDEQHFKRNPAETDQGIEELSNLLWRVHSISFKEISWITKNIHFWKMHLLYNSCKCCASPSHRYLIRYTFVEKIPWGDATKRRNFWWTNCIQKVMPIAWSRMVCVSIENVLIKCWTLLLRPAPLPNL